MVGCFIAFYRLFSSSILPWRLTLVLYLLSQMILRQGGVGLGGVITFCCTCVQPWCYANDSCPLSCYASDSCPLSCYAKDPSPVSCHVRDYSLLASTLQRLVSFLIWLILFFRCLYALGKPPEGTRNCLDYLSIRLTPMDYLHCLWTKTWDLKAWCRPLPDT